MKLKKDKTANGRDLGVEKMLHGHDDNMDARVHTHANVFHRLRLVTTTLRRTL